MNQVVSNTQVSWEDFLEKYQPKQNHLKNNAPFDGLMYETFGAEVEHVMEVNKTNPELVWTVLDCEGNFVIASGWSFVNRIGYIIATVACVGDVEVIDDDDDEPFELPYGIQIALGPHTSNAGITSNLRQEFSLQGEIDSKAEIAADAIESLLLAIVAEGVDINTRQYADAITSAVESVAHHLEEI